MSLWRWLAGVLCLCAAAPAAAHTRSVSYSLWDLTETGAMVRVRIARLELTRLGIDPLASPADDRTAAAIVADSVRMRVNGEPCAVSETPRRTGSGDEAVSYAWRVDCGRTGGRAVESRLLHDVAPSHLHFARVRDGAAAPVERVLTEAQPLWRLDDGGVGRQAIGSGVVEYVKLGIEHILSGWDHLAFVAGLMLLAYGVRDVAVLVTSFTVAHSVTLGLTVLGAVRPAERAVEALIGYSIALVGIENAWLMAGGGLAVPLLVVGGTLALALPPSQLPALSAAGLAMFSGCHFALLRRVRRPERLRAAVAFAFGLIHGFGFAGVMMQLDIGQARLVPALFGFNLGVEIGQLAVVASVWPLLALVRRSPVAAAWTSDVGSAAVAGLGLFWLVTRSFAN